MKKTLLLLGALLAASPLTHANHNGTKAWLDEINQTYWAFAGKVKNENINFKWAKDGKAIFAELKNPEDQPQWHRYDLSTGKSTLIEGTPEGDDFHKPDKNTSIEIPTTRPWEAKIKDAEITFTSEQDTHTTPVTSLPEGSHWTRRQHWSPDGQAVALWHNTSHPVRQVHYVRSSPEDQLQPQHFTRDYPKPGDELNIAHPVIFFANGDAPIPLDPKLVPAPFEIRHAHWSKDSKRFTVEYVERGFSKLQILEINTETRQQRILVSEDSGHFVFVYGNTFRFNLDQTDEILWLSERTGYNHLYLIDALTGKAKKQLTKGDYVVREVVEVNEKKRTAIVKLSGCHPTQDPYYIHFAHIDLDSAKLTPLTDSDGTHEIFFSPDRSHYLAKWSRVDHPPVYEIRRFSDTKKIATLPTPDLTPLIEAGWQRPERFVTKDRNDKYEIHGVIFRPRNFDPNKKYPVIENIYAGPHGAFTPKAWSTWYGHKSEIAESGFIVVQLDGLGTNYRGREFQQFAYKNIIDSGFPDRIKWIKAAAEKYPYMDLTRIGIYGGSAGGQSTLAALLTHPEFYKVGVADCGCHDNRMDKIWWNEQWMGWPVDDSYAQNSNLTHIKNLQGAIMLTVGEVDTNVDPSSTLQVVNALIQNDKDFEYIIAPNAEHGAGESNYLRRKRSDFFLKHLTP